MDEKPSCSHQMYFQRNTGVKKKVKANKDCGKKKREKKPVATIIGCR